MEASSAIAWKGFKKRDGTEVPFSLEKIKTAVRKALQSCGCHYATATANDVVGGVVEELALRGGVYHVPYDKAVDLGTLQGAILEVLNKKSLHHVAAAFKSYSEQRDHVRKALAVKTGKKKKKTDTTDKSLLLVETAEDQHTEPWDRKKIEEKLRQQAHLKKEEAEIVAKLVENRVVASGMKFLTSPFIRELVNATLEERKHKAKVRDLEVFPVSADFVDSLMDSKSVENSNISSNNPEAVSLAVSEYVLKEWALSRVFSEKVKQAHLTGAVQLHDLSFPHRVYALSPSTEVTVRRKGERRTSTLADLWYSLSTEETHLEGNHYQKLFSDEGVEILDRGAWVRVERLVMAKEVKKTFEFILEGGDKVAVTEEHGCIVRRDNKLVIVRADEVRPTDKFIRIST